MKLSICLLFMIVYILNATAFKNEKCGLPHSRNGDGRSSCDAYFPSWSYDSQNNKCVEFIYGGCDGNDNRFETKEECQATCLEK